MDHDEQKARMKQIVAGWKATNAITDAELRRDLPTLDTSSALLSLRSLFNMATRDLPPRKTSGLIEMQKWFAKSPK